MHPTAALQHAGLAFQRLIWYARPWEMNQEHQHAILAEIASQSQTPAQRPEQFAAALNALHGRAEAAQQSLSEAGWKGRAFSATVQWRLVTGLGAAGILEGAGMVLHRLYGFPYLPGSSLKGLVRHYLWLNGHDDDHDPLMIRMFGSQERRGEVIFWDALPEAWPALEVDITNVHYPEYYRQAMVQGLPVPPADYLSPNPVYFLTVRSGTRFRFRLLAHNTDILEQTVRSMHEAIELLGVGAKTRAGYGELLLSKS